MSHEPIVLNKLDRFFSMQAACGGIIRGAGKQKVGAVCNIVGYYCIGFPIGLPLMFVAKMGIKGRFCSTTLFWGLTEWIIPSVLKL